MRRSLVLLVGLSIIASPALAGEYKSSFGFNATVPSTWLVLSRQEIRDNPDLFNGVSSEPRLASMNSQLLSQVIKQIESGQIEMLFRQSNSVSNFSDNVNVMKQIGKIPKKEELSKVCDQLPGMFEQYFGHPTDLHVCELGVVAERPSLHIEFDGAMEGTTSVQYQIQKSENVQIIITATASDETISLVKGEFSSIIDSLKFLSPGSS